MAQKQTDSRAATFKSEAEISWHILTPGTALMGQGYSLVSFYTSTGVHIVILFYIMLFYFISFYFCVLYNIQTEFLDVT